MAAAFVAAALGAWLSQGTIALATPEGPRIALLPMPVAAIALAVAAGAVTAVLVGRGASPGPLGLLAFLLLPWIPFGLPAAFLMWSGPMTLLIWLAIAWNMVPRTVIRELTVAHSPAIRAGILGFVIFGAAAWSAAPAVPNGDEPHYLVITQSLLYDRDLKIENNHRRRDYHAYTLADLRPDHLRRGRDGEIYSIHAPGISALVAPAFAVGGHPATMLFLLLVSAAGSALLWHVIWLATRHVVASWFGWASVTLSATHIFHTFTVYPDGIGGLLTLTGIFALLRTEEERRARSTVVMPWWLHGAALALLPWLHSRFAVLAGSLGSLILLRLGGVPNPAAKAAAFLAVPAISALGWVGYFVAIYGTADPSAPYGSAPLGTISNIPSGLGGLMFDHRFGLLANAPVMAFGIVGLFAMLRNRGRREGAPEVTLPGLGSRRLGLELLFVAVPYLLTVTNFTMWWGGWSAPARFVVPVLPVVGIGGGFAWLAIRHRATRSVAIGALVTTAFITAVLTVPERGALAYNTRVAPGLWLEWASTLVDLARGVPDWFREPQETFIGDVGIWLGMLLAGWLILRAIASAASLRREMLATAGVTLYVFLAMASLTIVWMRHGEDGLTNRVAQMSYLRRLAADSHSLSLQLTPLSRLDAQQALSLLKIWGRPEDQPNGGAGPDDQPLLVLPAVPAGQYRLRARTRGPGGWLMVGIGPDQFSIRTEALQVPADPVLIDFPVEVRALIVRGDEKARQVVRRIDVEPLSLRPRASTPTAEVARRAVRYGAASVFFVDDRSYPEPDAFWIGGSRAASVVVQPDAAVAAVPLLLRNAPVNNSVVVTAGSWREDMQLAPGELRRLRVPVDDGRGSILIRFDVAAGFRPSEADPGSRDDRFLGVWVQPER